MARAAVGTGRRGHAATQNREPAQPPPPPSSVSRGELADFDSQPCNACTSQAGTQPAKSEAEDTLELHDQARRIGLDDVVAAMSARKATMFPNDLRHLFEVELTLTHDGRQPARGAFPSQRSPRDSCRQVCPRLAGAEPAEPDIERVGTCRPSREPVALPDIRCATWLEDPLPETENQCR